MTIKKRQRRRRSKYKRRVRKSRRSRRSGFGKRPTPYSQSGKNFCHTQYPIEIWQSRSLDDQIIALAKELGMKWKGSGAFIGGKHRDNDFVNATSTTCNQLKREIIKMIRNL